jgi:hypothetical protein
MAAHSIKVAWMRDDGSMELVDMHELRRRSRERAAKTFQAAESSREKSVLRESLELARFLLWFHKNKEIVDGKLTGREFTDDHVKVPYRSYEAIASLAARVGLQGGARRDKGKQDRERYRQAWKRSETEHPRLNRQQRKKRVARELSVHPKTIERALQKK